MRFKLMAAIGSWSSHPRQVFKVPQNKRRRQQLTIIYGYSEVYVE